MRTLWGRVSGGPKADKQGLEFEMPQKVQKCCEIIYFTALSDGLEGDRTLDLRVANAALSHLSYKNRVRFGLVAFRNHTAIIALCAMMAAKKLSLVYSNKQPLRPFFDRRAQNSFA